MFRINNILQVIVLPIVAVFIGGCSVGPNYEPVEMETPDAWHAKVAQAESGGFDISKQWWKIFEDEKLEELILLARENNPDLETAYWRLREARYQRDLATGDFYPDLDAKGSYSRYRSSENGRTPPLPGAGADQYNLHNVGFDSSWEIDIFGRTSRYVESAQANLEAKIESYHDVMVSLYSEVATNYIDLRSAQARIKYAVDNIKSQSETLELTLARYKAEISPELDVEQAKLNLANTKAQIPSLRIIEAAAINRLCALVSISPSELFQELSVTKKIPVAHDEILISLPTELLRRRADIRNAERNLASQTAKIGMAKSQLYPSFTLTGTFEFEAMNFADLGNLSSRQYSFGPGFRWNIFDAKRIKNNVKIEEAKTKQLYSLYEKTVLGAIEDVENSFSAYHYEKQRCDSLSQSVVAAKRSVKLVDTLYRNGLTEFQNVLDMQRTLFVQQDNLAQSRGAVSKNMIRICKALGGGWEKDQMQAEAESKK